MTSQLSHDGKWALRRLFALPRSFVKGTLKLPITQEGLFQLEWTHLKEANKIKVAFTITVRACWTYAIYSTCFYTLVES